MAARVAQCPYHRFPLTLIIYRRCANLRPTLPQIEALLVFASRVHPVRASSREMSLSVVAIGKISQNHQIVGIFTEHLRDYRLPLLQIYGSWSQRAYWHQLRPGFMQDEPKEIAKREI